ncbi:hypothetical protein [Sphaerothrix gracilis]|uniref:hypothetical protein n=1 Tax=Sphaerothrix gracilis TaxID=3151835 RepID=UPI0031FE271D
MTTDRLDRIEAMLEALGQRHLEANERLSRIESITESNARAANERLSRIESITESNAKAITANSSAIAETRKIADSNACSIEAWAQTIQDDRADREEEDSRIRIDLRTTHDMISGLIQERRTDWAEWRRQQEERDQRFTNLLEDAREDRKANQKKHEEMLARMDTDRRENQKDHDAALENIQVLLVEIARLWQRLEAS